MSFDWRALAAHDVEQHFNPRLAVEDADADLARLTQKAADARRVLQAQYDLPYGNSAKETYDYFPAQTRNAPVVVFIHGGFWRAFDKSDHSHLAVPFVANGIAHISLNYDLCPTVTLDTIVDQMRRAVAHIHASAPDLGIDRERIYLAGHSAGGQLVAMLLAQDWTRFGMPDQPFRGALPLSGIFDPAPVLQMPINQEIRLTPDMAARNNTLALPIVCTCPQIVAVGALEPDGWRAQSQEYAAHAQAAGVAAHYVEVAGRQHFTLLDALADPEDPLFRAFRAMIQGDGPGL